MTPIALHERPEAVLRCAICHDKPLPLERCARCRSAFHGECRAALRRCPTLGCVHPMALAVAGRSPSAWHTLVAACMVTGLPTAVLGHYVVSAISRVPWDLYGDDPTDRPEFKIAFLLLVAVAALHFVVIPGSWACQAVRDETGPRLVLSTLAAELVFGLWAIFGLACASGLPAPLWLVLIFVALVAVPTIAYSCVTAEPVALAALATSRRNRDDDRSRG